MIFSKKESETVILKIIRYRHLFLCGLDRGLVFFFKRTSPSPIPSPQEASPSPSPNPLKLDTSTTSLTDVQQHVQYEFIWIRRACDYIW